MIRVYIVTLYLNYYFNIYNNTLLYIIVTLTAAIRMKHFLFVISLLSLTIMSFAVDLKTIYEWKYVDYQWYSPREKQKAIDSGNYNASSCVLYDVDKAPGRLILFEGFYIKI